MNVILAWIMKLFANPKLLAIIVAVLLCLYGAYKVNEAWDDLHEKVAVSEKKAVDAVKEQARLKVELTTAVGVNKSNQNVIEQMKADKMLNDARVADLNKALSSDKRNSNKILSDIHKAPAQDDGAVSKVLKDTLRTLQNKGDKK